MIGLSAGFYSASAVSCSCVSSKETAREVRGRIQAYYGAENVVLLRATKVIEVGDSHEQAELRVVESWKGGYSVGDIVRSDTSNIGWGMCDSPIRVGEEILMVFSAEPVRISGCPSDFVLTAMQRKFLKRLAPKKAQRRSQETKRGAPNQASGVF
jgi:hypothetical protein